MLIKNLKHEIKELAKTAVILAEKSLGSKKGKEKKEMAINYIVSNIPVHPTFKPLLTIFLSSFIDNAVEFAVEYMEEK